MCSQVNSIRFCTVPAYNVSSFFFCCFLVCTFVCAPKGSFFLPSSAGQLSGSVRQKMLRPSPPQKQDTSLLHDSRHHPRLPQPDSLPLNTTSQHQVLRQPQTHLLPHLIFYTSSLIRPPTGGEKTSITHF